MKYRENVRCLSMSFINMMLNTEPVPVTDKESQIEDRGIKYRIKVSSSLKKKQTRHSSIIPNSLCGWSPGPEENYSEEHS